MILVSELARRQQWVKCSCRLPCSLKVGFSGVAVFKHDQVLSWVEAMAMAVVVHYSDRGLISDDDGRLARFCNPIEIDPRKNILPPPTEVDRRNLNPELPAFVWALVRADATSQRMQINAVLLGICTDYLIRVGLYPEDYRMPIARA